VRQARQQSPQKAFEEAVKQVPGLSPLASHYFPRFL
jgi:hypothetical protein